MLRKFDILKPYTFSEVITQDLNSKTQRDVKKRAVQKFSIFWKLTSPMTLKDSTDGNSINYKPF